MSVFLVEDAKSALVHTALEATRKGKDVPNQTSPRAVPCLISAEGRNSRQIWKRIVLRINSSSSALYGYRWIVLWSRERMFKIEDIDLTTHGIQLTAFPILFSSP